VSTVFRGTLASSPAYKAKGNLGDFDLQCTGPYTCGGTWPSALSYSTTTSGFDLADWSWGYHTAKNGNWTNAASGNSGDISG
jgi:hypothetical protein